MGEKYKNAVKLEDGKLANFTMKIKGKPFYCQCGCNVFHKPDKGNLERYKCNCCDVEFQAS